MKIKEYEKGEYKVQCHNCEKWVDTIEYRAKCEYKPGNWYYLCRACTSTLKATLPHDYEEVAEIFLSLSDLTKCPDMQALASMTDTIYIQRCRQ